MTPGAILYDRLGRRCVVVSGPVRGRYEVQRRKVIVWVAERRRHLDPNAPGEAMIRRLVARLADRGWWRLARLLGCFTGPPTNRAHLLLNPSPSDDCVYYVPRSALVPADCSSDGHYLCRGCGRHSPQERL